MEVITKQSKRFVSTDGKMLSLRDFCFGVDGGLKNS